MNVAVKWLLCDPRCADMYDVLVPFAGTEALCYAACYPGTPGTTLTRLAAGDGCPTDGPIRLAMRRLVADNRGAPPATLTALSTDEDVPTRQNVAGNHSTAPEVLRALAEDGDSHVRNYVATNPSAPAEVLARLGWDDDMIVRYFIAKNPRTSTEDLARLSDDKDWHVQRAARTNPRTMPGKRSTALSRKGRRRRHR